MKAGGKEWRGILVVIFAVSAFAIIAEMTTWSLIVRLLALLVILGAAFLIFYLIKTILKGR
jgi:hypothetical protein